MTNKKIIEELIEELGESLRTVDVPYSNIGGFGHKAQVQHDKKDLLKEVEGTIQQALSAQKQEIKEMVEGVSAIDDSGVAEFIKSIILRGLEKL